MGFPGGAVVRKMCLPGQDIQEIWILSLDWEDSLEEVMAAHSNILAWKISKAEESGWLQTMWSQRVRHN